MFFFLCLWIIASDPFYIESVHEHISSDKLWFKVVKFSPGMWDNCWLQVCSVPTSCCQEHVLKGIAMRWQHNSVMSRFTDLLLNLDGWTLTNDNKQLYLWLKPAASEVQKYAFTQGPALSKRKLAIPNESVHLRLLLIRYLRCYEAAGLTRLLEKSLMHWTSPLHKETFDKWDYCR